MGSVDTGVCCMAWSPDQELVILASGQGKLLVMTRDFDPISESALHPEEFGEGGHRVMRIVWAYREYHAFFSKTRDCWLGQEGHPVSWFPGQANSRKVEGRG